LDWKAVAPQEDAMASQTSRLPSRFPVGTKFVIEGRPARGGKDGQVQVVSRHLEFPDGRLLSLPLRKLRRPLRLRTKLRRVRK
jgi:hypothetical protein